MGRGDYANPPVHEVILDIQFQDDLADADLDAIGRRLSASFGFPSRFTTFEIEAAMATTGAEQFSAKTTFAGWVFEEREPRWVLRTLRDRFTLNAARTGAWPKGPYVGWETIYDRFIAAFGELREFYESLEIRRIGLRYQNRIAIPEGTELADWFTLVFEGPAILHNVYSFSLRQTWENLIEHRDLSATINLARIAIGDPEIAKRKVGVLLDIDVFNLLVKQAPSFEESPDWYARAHSVENQIFEGCITNRLRETFDRRGD